MKTCENVTSELVFKVFFGSTSENFQVIKKDGSKIPVAHELVSVIMDSFILLQTDKLSLIKFLIFKRKAASFLPTRGESELQNRLVALKEICYKFILIRKEELVKDSTLYKKNFLD